MSFFKEVEGEAAVLIENGVYRQVPIFVRDGFLYAKSSGGFVKLMADGSTTKAKMRLDFMSWNGPLYRDALGRLCGEKIAGVVALPAETAQKLIGGSA